MNKTLSRGLMACLSLVALASCQDYDGGFDEGQIKKAAYAKHFEDTFGKIDPNQDWSMATLVKANVNLPGLTGTAKMNICTGDPRNSETRLLAQIMLKDGKGSIDFDAIKGSDNVFVTVEQDGEYKVFSQYQITNGMLNLGEVATRAKMPGFNDLLSISDDCPTTVVKDGDPVSIDCINIPTTDIIGYTYAPTGWTPVSKTFAEWKTAARSALPNNNPTIYTNESLFRYKRDYVDFSSKVAKELVPVVDGDGNQLEYEGVKQWASGPLNNDNGTITYFYNQNTSTTKTISEWEASYTISNHTLNSFDGPWTLESLSVKTEFCSSSTSGAYYVDVDPDDTNWEIKTDGSVSNYYGTAHPKWQYISGVEKGECSWYIGWGSALFGAGALFAESVEYWADSKMALYDASTIGTMEEGLEIVTTANQGPIDIPYIFGCTDYYNQFGYVYYTEGQDPLLQTHYVLINDARPSKNMSIDGTAVGNKSLSTYVQDCQTASGYTDTSYGQADYLAQANKQVIGTTYRLMYYDEVNKQFTYEFPAGVHIVFFIDDLGSETNQQNHTGHKAANYNYSLPQLNERIGHTTPANGKDRPGGPAGLVKCIAFSSGGVNYVGFGDNSGDEDLNDIVLAINGATPQNKVETCPIIWHINENGTSGPDVESDIFSRETVIVGKTYNSPSNTPSNGTKTFRGWSSTPDNSSNDLFTTLTNAPTSSTAAIHYYAIWDDGTTPTPGPDPVPVSWIFACEDLGGTFDYDFNDVVWEVQKAYSDGSCTGAQVSVLAAGGTLPFTLKYGTTDICTKVEAFDGIDNTTIVNAGPKGVSKDPKVFNVTGIGADWTVSGNYTNFFVEVEHASHTDHISAYKKESTLQNNTPQVILLPGEWEWPTEETHIDDAYTNFKTWVTSSVAAPWSEWRSHKQANLTVSHSVWNPEVGPIQPQGGGDYSQYGTSVPLVEGKDSNPALVSITDILAVKNEGVHTITFICESNNGGSWINWSTDGSSVVGGANVSGTSIEFSSSTIEGTSYYAATITAESGSLSSCSYSHLGISLWTGAKVLQVRVK